MRLYNHVVDLCVRFSNEEQCDFLALTEVLNSSCAPPTMILRHFRSWIFASASSDAFRGVIEMNNIIFFFSIFRRREQKGGSRPESRR